MLKQLVLILLLAFTPSLAIASKSSATPSTPQLPENALPVPLVRQSETYSCGAAATLAVLYYWQKYDGGEHSLFPLLGTTDDGTNPENIVKGIRTLGLEAEVRENLELNDLRHYLSQETPVILEIQAWQDEPKVPWEQSYDNGHFAVLIAMDQNYAYFMDPSSPAAYAYMELPDLMSRWHDKDDVIDPRTGKIAKNPKTNATLERKTFHLGVIIRRADGQHLHSVPAPLQKLD